MRRIIKVVPAIAREVSNRCFARLASHFAWLPGSGALFRVRLRTLLHTLLRTLLRAPPRAPASALVRAIWSGALASRPASRSC